MNEKKERKLRLNKITVQNLDTLNKDEQKVIKGGSDNNQPGITNRPIFC
jgi:hypothetical protein